MTKIIAGAFCEIGAAALLAAMLWEKPCCSEQLPLTKIFGFPFWRHENDADVSVRITIDDKSDGTRGGKLGALRYSSASLAEQFARNAGFKTDDDIHPLIIAGKRISKEKFPGSVPCTITFEVFNGCDAVVT